MPVADVARRSEAITESRGEYGGAPRGARVETVLLAGRAAPRACAEIRSASVIRCGPPPADTDNARDRRRRVLVMRIAH